MLDVAISIVINIALLVFWSLLFYFFNRKKAIIFSGASLGILGVFILAGLIEFFWFDITSIKLTEQQSKTVVAPIVEEGSKLLFILLAFRFSQTHISLGTKVFGASLGLGFAFIENFGFIANFLNVLFRGFSSWPMHIGTSTLLSYGVGYVLKY